MITQERILVVESDEDDRHQARAACESPNRQVVEAASGPEALELALTENFDAIVLEKDLPGMTGFEVCRRLREEGRHTPIVLMSSRPALIDKVVGLEIGADDYIARPFEAHELSARVDVQLRHYHAGVEPKPPERFEFPGLVIDLVGRRVWKEGADVELTATEFDVLSYLASRPGRAVSRRELLETLWDDAGGTFDTRTVDAHVYRLRAKIEDDRRHPTRIRSVLGVGYRFSP